MHGGLRKGFTLIELSLSIVFIAILSITIVLIISNTISSYHRGLTLSQINTTGMDLVDDMRATIQNSPSWPVENECDAYYTEDSEAYKSCIEDGARKFVVRVKRGERVNMGGGRSVENAPPMWGVFCTGTYSYIWNSGYFFNTEYEVEGAGMVSVDYSASSDADDMTNISGFKMLKVQDDTRTACASLISNEYEDDFPDDNIIELKTLLGEAPVDLIAGAEDLEETKVERSNLAIYDLSSAAPASGGMAKNLFYSVSFILGTVQGGVNVMSAKGNFCATPNDYSENFDYCAINKFNFAAQATGG